MDLNIGKKYIQEKKFEKAELYFLNLIKNGNKSSRVYFFLGLTYFELNKFKKSIFYYQECLKLDPKSINTLLNLAYAKQAIGSILSAKNISICIL